MGDTYECDDDVHGEWNQKLFQRELVWRVVVIFQTTAWARKKSTKPIVTPFDEFQQDTPCMGEEEDLGL